MEQAKSNKDWVLDFNKSHNSALYLSQVTQISLRKTISISLLLIFDIRTTNTYISEFEINLSTKLFSTNTILLYPNPTNSILNVSLKDTNESLAKITIYDMIGKTIQTVSGNSLQQIAINVENLSTGIYMIEITTDSNLKQTRKFIVE